MREEDPSPTSGPQSATFEERSQPMSSIQPMEQGALERRLIAEMVRIRLSMLAFDRIMRTEGFRVPMHFAFGHEAVAAAVSQTMERGDQLSLTHRNIHYNIARETDIRAELDEYRLLEKGLAGGAMGAMNLRNPKGGVIYTSSILGNCLPVAVGVAKALRAAGGVVFAVTGDGALEEGAFYEALILARSVGAGVVFLVENNGWSMYSRIEERRGPIDLKAMSVAVDATYASLDGGDPAQCLATLSAARAEAAAGRPTIVEASVTTFGGYYAEDGAGGSRFINYHHGALHGSIDPAAAIFERSERDPLHKAAEELGVQEWTMLLESIGKEIARRLD